MQLWGTTQQLTVLRGSQDWIMVINGGRGCQQDTPQSWAVALRCGSGQSSREWDKQVQCTARGSPQRQGFGISEGRGTDIPGLAHEAGVQQPRLLGQLPGASRAALGPR